MSEEHIGRWLFDGQSIREGFIRAREDVVEEVCWGRAPAESSRAVILPGFVNAHTHLGDAFAYPAPKGSVEEIVAPPDGYKHRMLRNTDRPEKVLGIRRFASLMDSSGTSLFADFREEGLDGVRMLREGVGARPQAVVLGRPVGPDADDEELEEILQTCDGFGASSIRDWPYDLLSRMSSLCRSRGKLFALHSSETVREDIDKILDLKPHYLVHMTAASISDLERCAQAGVPVVVCPRSNQFFGIDPRIPTLLRSGLEIALGTDNAMITPPDMLQEVRAAYRISGGSAGVEAVELLRLATIAGQKVLKAEREITTEISCEDDLTVVEVGGDDPIDSVVGRGRPGFVKFVCRGGKLRRP